MRILLVLAVVGFLFWGFQSSKCRGCVKGQITKTEQTDCVNCKGRSQVKCEFSNRWFREATGSPIFHRNTVKGPDGKRGWYIGYRCEGGRITGYDDYEGDVCWKCNGTAYLDCTNCTGYGYIKRTKYDRHSSCNGTGQILNFQKLFN